MNTPRRAVTLIASRGLLVAALGLAACPGETTSGSEDTAALDTVFVPQDILVPDTVTANDTGAPDADAQPPVDTTPIDCPGAFGCACAGNDDCASELCIEGPDGQACTRTCVATCPDGYDCLTSGAFGPDVISVCIPRHTRLCRPCHDNSDCQNPFDPLPAYCVTTDPVAGSFCSSSCANIPCPSGYACATVDLGGGATAKQCVPEEGATCACRPSWADLGLSTSCLVSNDVGACEGTRSCGVDGLTSCAGPEATLETCNGVDDDCDGETDNLIEASCERHSAFGTCSGVLACDEAFTAYCDAPQPSAEVCDGIDQDCDGATDEGSCDDGFACTDDVCVSATGTCNATLEPNACLIAQVCYSENDINPADPCQVCRPLLNPYGWSLATNACTIDGVCYADGAARPGKPCDVCRAADDPLGWTPLAEGDKCDDGDPCTFDEVCQATECVGALTPDRCEDGLACTLDACNGDGTCTHTPVAATCVIAGACYTAGVANPAAECERCEPAADPRSWSPAPDTTPCDDETVCTTGDHCDGAGACAGDTVSCDDALDCTADTCDPVDGCVHTPVDACVIDGACVAGGATRSVAEACLVCTPASSTDDWSVAQDSCFIDGACVASGSVDPEDDCRRCVPGTSQSAYVPVSVGTCGDPGVCLAGGHCVAGSCEGASDKCDDGLGCTAGTCNGDGTCSFEIVSGSCLIGDACYGNGTVNPDDPCQVCDASEDAEGWSPNPARCLIGEVCWNDGQADPTNACLVCDPVASRTTWTAASVETSCNDQNACSTDDHCDGAGACVGDLSCDDALSCTTDLCTLGGCVNIVAPSSCVIDGVCEAAGADAGQPCLTCQPAVSQEAWTPAATSVACDDGSPCSTDDHCDGAGACTGNTSCNDGTFCTNDVCTAAGCTHAIESGWCVIGGACRGEGTKAAQGCLVCDPAASDTAWTAVAANTGCDDGNACSVGERCDGAGSCVGDTSCNDHIVCTDDSCDPLVGCAHDVVDDWCLIGGTCHTSGAAIANGCATCDPTSTPYDWTATASGVSCDNGDPCPANAACDGLGACVGDGSCDDGDACTIDECTPTGCLHDQVALGKCIIDGQCYDAGPKPGNPCLACVPSVDQRAWTAAAATTGCDDGSPCSEDDHCDGAGACVGDTSCDDGVACTDDVCGPGGCGNPVSSGACLIDGACVGAGPDEGNTCRSCTPAVSQSAWTYAPVTTSCDDGSPCSSDDHCDGGGSCVGDTGCDDGKSCTLNRCTATGCDWSQISDGWCLIGGVCRTSGSDPGNVCRTCDPGSSQLAWTPAPTSTTCSDGSACSTDDHCDGQGACTGDTSCDDGLSCTDDACTPSGCDHSQVAAGKCLIGGQCYSAGPKPGNPCLVCNPSLDPRDWTPASTATACNDQSACSTDDHCDGQGACVGDTSCDDGIACTLDVCGVSGCSHSGIPSGWCRIGGTCYQNGAANPANACQRCDSGSPTAWTNEPTTKACDDNNGCSPVSYCNGAGACVGDTSCNDGVSCTDDVCLSLYGSKFCVNPVASGKCRIDGQCYSTGQTQSGNICYRCDPSGSGGTTDWSYNNGASCTDGYGLCTSNDVCTNGVCQGTFESDAYEPNETASAPRYLGSRDDDMDWGVSTTANLWGPGDEDWYRFHVNDTFFGNAQPRVRLRNIPSGHDYDLCVYIRCTDGYAIPSVSCPSGTLFDTWTIGGTVYPGCCSIEAGTASEDIHFTDSGNYECDSSDDSYDAYVNIYKYSGAGTCADYTLDWGDD